ncbi:MAG: hypothetical protein EXQ86_06925 [Rhodospirillales bacterium]|nr:hypothetical protein [Rhodospirillales bacterium]
MGRKLAGLVIGGACALLLAACSGSIVNPPPRLGMVKDPETGLMLGSVVEKSFVTDASFYRNKRIKVRVRNTSGDTAFDLKGFTGRIESAYAANGYQPTHGDDFGVMVDVNVVYSGQVQTNLASEFTFLGAAAGTAAGATAGGVAGGAIGAVSGATFGNVVGSFVTDDTYIIVARVTFAEIKEPLKSEGKTVIFSRSPTPGLTKEEEEEKELKRLDRNIKRSISTGISVYAGGRNVRQSEIAGQVRDRFVRIISDVI